MTRDIALGLIDPNPDNPRKTYHRIQELAATIEGLGLLQNLVVIQHGGGPPEPPRFMLRAGHRRLRAMLLLVERKSPGWTLETKVPCHILQPGKEGDLEALVENIQREATYPWEEGASFDRIVQTQGLTFEEIGKQIGRSRSQVSLRVRISRGLSPKLVPILVRIGSAGPNVNDLDKLAAMTDKDTLGADHDKQRAWLERYLTTEPKKRKKYKTRQMMDERIRKLDEMKLPENIRAIIDSVIRYLGGEDLVLPGFTDRMSGSGYAGRQEPFHPTMLESALGEVIEESP